MLHYGVCSYYKNVERFNFRSVILSVWIFQYRTLVPTKLYESFLVDLLGLLSTLFSERLLFINIMRSLQRPSVSNGQYCLWYEVMGRISRAWCLTPRFPTTFVMPLRVLYHKNMKDTAHVTLRQICQQPKACTFTRTLKQNGNAVSLLGRQK